jgi:hypothetical protein
MSRCGRAARASDCGRFVRAPAFFSSSVLPHSLPLHCRFLSPQDHASRPGPSLCVLPSISSSPSCVVLRSGSSVRTLSPPHTPLIPRVPVSVCSLAPSPPPISHAPSSTAARSSRRPQNESVTDSQLAVSSDPAGGVEKAAWHSRTRALPRLLLLLACRGAAHSVRERVSPSEERPAPSL